jgi:hypothetical protein
MNDLESEWQRKGATLSDKTARKEFGLSEAEIVEAIRAGKLRFREGSTFGNPFLRLLRSEVEALVQKKHGTKHLEDQRAKCKLDGIDRELKRLKLRVAKLEKQRSTLLAAKE